MTLWGMPSLAVCGLYRICVNILLLPFDMYIFAGYTSLVNICRYGIRGDATILTAMQYQATRKAAGAKRSRRAEVPTLATAVGLFAPHVRLMEKSLIEKYLEFLLNV